jgi:hypothetical protein
MPDLRGRLSVRKGANFARPPPLQLAGITMNGGARERNNMYDAGVVQRSGVAEYADLASTPSYAEIATPVYAQPE